MIYTVEEVLAAFDSMLSTKRRRHIVGGLLLSASALFSGLAITVMTLGLEKKEVKKLDE